MILSTLKDEEIAVLLGYVSALGGEHSALLAEASKRLAGESEQARIDRHYTELLQMGTRTIAVIKQVRADGLIGTKTEDGMVTLKEAKEYVDELLAKAGLSVPPGR